VAVALDALDAQVSAPRWDRSIPPSTAPDSQDLTYRQRVRVVHPFHPLAGQDFEFVKRRKNWRADRVYFLDTADELVSVPAEWTDVVAPDPFVMVSAGRSPFHIADLIELARLVGELDHRSSGVKRTMP